MMVGVKIFDFHEVICVDFHARIRANLGVVNNGVMLLVGCVPSDSIWVESFGLILSGV